MPSAGGHRDGRDAAAGDPSSYEGLPPVGTLNGGGPPTPRWAGGTPTGTPAWWWATADPSRTKWGGPTSRSAPMSRSAAIRPSSTARSASAGTPGPPIRLHLRRSPRSVQTGGHTRPHQQTRTHPHNTSTPSRPHTLRAVRSGLTPALTLTRWWTAWSNAPPPAELEELLNAVNAGHSLLLYTPP